VVEHLAAADHAESSIVYGAEQLQESGIARAVDPRRTNHADGKPFTSAEVERQQLAITLRLLIVVARMVGCVFSCGGMLDISLHPDRATMDKALYSGSLRRLQ
jgi:hypothetical protein